MLDVFFVSFMCLAVNPRTHARLNTPLEVYKLLPKTNCGECGSYRCMAFAAAVIKQEKTLSDCPSLANGIAGQYDGRCNGR